MAKCMFFQTKMIFLGFESENGQVRIPKSRLDKIKDIQFPESQKQVKSMLYSLGFYRKFVSRLADESLCITKLLKKEEKADRK